MPMGSNKEPIFLDMDEETKKGILEVDPAIASHMKPHQIEGVKFIWDSVFENLKMIKEGHKGSGCILAHCMGLGKTFQIIALVHTLITHSELTNIKRVLILMPVNVIMNWRSEFNMWTRDCCERLGIYELPNMKGADRDLVRARVRELEKWFNKGGVFLMGYNMFARLVQGKSSKEIIIQRL